MCVNTLIIYCVLIYFLFIILSLLGGGERTQVRLADQSRPRYRLLQRRGAKCTRLLGCATFTTKVRLSLFFSLSLSLSRLLTRPSLLRGVLTDVSLLLLTLCVRNARNNVGATFAIHRCRQRRCSNAVVVVRLALRRRREDRGRGCCLVSDHEAHRAVLDVRSAVAAGIGTGDAASRRGW